MKPIKTNLILVAVLLANFVLTACGGGSVDSPSVAPQNSEPGAGPVGNWVGKVDGTNAFVALVADGTKIIGYVCDDGVIAEWFFGTASSHELILHSKDGAVLQASLHDNAHGRITLADGSEHEYSAQASKASVLFRADGSAGEPDDGADVVNLVGGWIEIGADVRGSIRITSSAGVSIQAAPKIADTISLALSDGILASLSPTPMTPATQNQPTANTLKFIWGAMGDSYASGEGNPLHGIADPSDINNFSGLVWGSDQSIFTPNSEGTYAGDLFTCHRSDAAGAPKAHRQLQRLYPGIEFKLGFVACSGAETRHLRINEYDGPAGIISAAMRGHATTTQAAQALRIRNFKQQNGDQLDAVYMAVGVNDIGFGEMIKDCLDPLVFDIFGGCAGKWRELLPANLGNLAKNYANLDTRIELLLGSNVPVFISEYPNPLDKNATPCVGDDYNLHGDVGLFGHDDILKNNISREEATFAASVPSKINGVIADTVSLLGWKIIRAPSFTQHGICTDIPFANLNSAALHLQGNDRPVFNFAISNGLIHPNDRGYTEYGEAIVSSLRPVVDSKIRTGLAAPARVSIGAVNQGIIKVQWDDRATAENSYEIEIRAARPEDISVLDYPAYAVRLASGDGYIQRIPATFQDFYHDPAGYGIFNYRVRACHSAIISGAQCGAFSAITTGANFRPSIPKGLAAKTILNTSTFTIRVQFSWIKQEEALEYVVRIPASSSGTEYRTTGGTLTLPLTVVQGQTTQVAACNRVGCSLYSAAITP